jgi:Zn finger protein HypA/HybF involved in hydrogenase expression
MHEGSAIANLVLQVTTIALQERATKVLRVHLRRGALCHLSTMHLQEHFAIAAQGTVAEGARLVITEATELSDPHAHELRLCRVIVNDK